MSHRKTRLIGAALVVIGLLLFAAAAYASPNQNATQPANVYFHTVPLGEHPSAYVTVRNGTGAPQTIRRFSLAGAGGGKFTYTWKVATCRVGMVLAPGGTCTLHVRVTAHKVGWWQSVIGIVYGPPRGSGPAVGMWNGGVYAHVVAE